MGKKIKNHYVSYKKSKRKNLFKLMVKIYFVIIILFCVAFIFGYAETDGSEYRSFKPQNENNSQKYVALTFDDGPNPKTTSVVLDALEKHNAAATFFVLGKLAARYPEQICRMASIGCEIGNHSWAHEYFTEISELKLYETIDDTFNALSSACGVKSNLIRAPGGKTNPEICRWLNKPIINWSVDTNDWLYHDTERLVNYVLQNTENGDIVLMHDIYPTTAYAVERIITGLSEKGFIFLTVSELLGLDKLGEMANGMVFYGNRR